MGNSEIPVPFIWPYVSHYGSCKAPFGHWAVSMPGRSRILFMALAFVAWPQTSWGSSQAATAPASGMAKGESVESYQSALPASLSFPTYQLWHSAAPGSKGRTPDDLPTLTVYRPSPDRQTGAAVVIAPGGGYINLSMALEGSEPASWFSAHGITAFVLKYRVGQAARLPDVLLDAARSIRFVRANARVFGVDPARIGMLGFSAGGHLAASIATAPPVIDGYISDPIDRVSGRPDFLILGYPWLEATIVGRDGDSPYCQFARDARIPCRPRDYASFLPVRNVTRQTPPTFIYHTTNDPLVPVEGSVRFYMALRVHGVPAELHAFADGPHGSGMGGPDAALSSWGELLENWLRARGLLTQVDQTRAN